jgi:thiamine biosynthesis lipoprotein
MVLGAEARTLELTHAGMRLDLGAIGKGFAADEALRALGRAGITHGLVEIGGDLAAGTPPPGSGGWRVAVAAAGVPDAPLLVSIAHAGVATSGDAEQSLEIDNTRYSHVVDPLTGLGLTSGVAVTVVAPDAAAADALASAISVLGPRRGLALLRRFPDTAALVDVPTPEGRRRVWSEAFPFGKGLRD